MFAIVSRAFLWLSGGYVLNDVTSTIGKLFGIKSSDDDDSKAPWWVWPLVIIVAIIAFMLWLRKRK